MIDLGRFSFHPVFGLSWPLPLSKPKGTAPTNLSPCFINCHGIAGAFRYDIPLPLGNGGQDVHHHPAIGGGGVEIILQAGKGNAVVAEHIFDQITQILDGPGQGDPTFKVTTTSNCLLFSTLDDLLYAWPIQIFSAAALIPGDMKKLPIFSHTIGPDLDLLGLPGKSHYGLDRLSRRVYIRLLSSLNSNIMMRFSCV